MCVCMIFTGVLFRVLLLCALFLCINVSGWHSVLHLHANNFLFLQKLNVVIIYIEDNIC